MVNVRWILAADPPKDLPKRAQMEALRRSYPKSGWGHFLDMGLGKTCVALNEFCMFVEDEGFERLVVWAPNNFKPEWEETAKEFRFPYPFYTFESGNREGFRRWAAKQTGPCAVAINYETSIRRESTGAIAEFVRGRKAYVAYDESIWLKNPSSQYFKALKAMSHLYAVARDLSGKPLTQGPQDLWAQLRMIGALDGWAFLPFRNRYARMGGFKNKQVVGTRNKAELNEYLREWSFLASKADWSDIRRKNCLGPWRDKRLRSPPGRS